jgi:hypothetical protein
LRFWISSNVAAVGGESEEARRRREYEEEMREMKETYKKEIGDESGEIAAGIGGLALDDDDDDVPDLVDDFLGDIVDEIVDEIVEVPEIVAEKVKVEKVVPSEYVCPISFHIMTSAVIAMDGHSYEQLAIEEWVATCIRKKLPVTFPFTNMPMASTIIPNLTLRNLIRAFLEEGC